jgi:hypothetical protein
VDVAEKERKSRGEDGDVDIGGLGGTTMAREGGRVCLQLGSDKRVTVLSLSSLMKLNKPEHSKNRRKGWHTKPHRWRHSQLALSSASTVYLVTPKHIHAYLAVSRIQMICTTHRVRVCVELVEVVGEGQPSAASATVPIRDDALQIVSEFCHAKLIVELCWLSSGFPMRKYSNSPKRASSRLLNVKLNKSGIHKK